MHAILRSLFAIALAFACHAHAAAISVTPSSTDVVTGDTFAIMVDIADLVDGGAPSLGGFDLDVLYDEGVLALTAAGFGSGLDVLGLGSLQASDTSVPGAANFFEVSFDSIADLNALQPDAFPLLQLTFEAIGSGTSTIGILINSLADAAGAPLTASVTGGLVNVGVNVVPLPSTAWLSLAAMAALVFVRRRGQP